MEEENKNFIIEVVIFFVIIAISVFSLLKIMEYSKRSTEEYRQKRIQEISECLEKASDKDWCFDKFLK